MNEAVSRGVLAAHVSSTRLAWIERLRLVAMLEIVGFHALVPERLPFIGALGLAVFLLLGAAFSAQAAERRGGLAVAAAKVRTVGAAWLFWSLVYLALRLFFAWRRGLSIGPLLDPLLLIAGVRAHLWFAPFAVFAGATAAVLHGFTRGLSLVTRALGFMSVALVGVVLCDDLHGIRPWPQWAFALPSIPWGLSLASLLFARGRERTKLGIAFVLFACAVLGALPWLRDLLGADFGWTGETLRRYSVSTLLITIACMLPGSLDAVTKRFAPYMLGVYFVHILFVDVLRGRMPDSPWIASLLVFALGIAAVEVLQRTPLRRFVVMEVRK